jgi:hypothetical protein
MTSYIDKNLRTYGRVNTDWASRYFSDRFLNSNEMVCPIRKTYDLNGRPSDHYSIITTTAGCNSAGERILIEDAQRPKTFVMPGLNSLGVDGYLCGAGENLQQTNFDLQQYQLSSKGLLPDIRAQFSQRARDEQWNNMADRVQYYKYYSGM